MAEANLEQTQGVSSDIKGSIGRPHSDGDCLETSENQELMKGMEKSLNSLKLDNDDVATDQARALDLKLEELDLRSLNTKQCPPIVLIAGDKCEIFPIANRYAINGKFLRPARVDKWAMVMLFDEHIVLDVEKGLRLLEEVRRFAVRYTHIGRSRGVYVNHMDTIHIIPERPSVENTIEKMEKGLLKSELRQLIAKLNDQLVDHVLIILPENCPLWVHGYLQYLETVQWGLVKRRGVNLLARTSRMQYGTLMRLAVRSRDGGISNLIPQLWLKYNTKMGGLNVALKRSFDTHGLKHLDEGCLILSIDLCKLGPTAADSAGHVFDQVSIASAVGMWDLTSNKMSFRSQTRAQVDDIAVEDIDLLALDIIESYRKRKGGLLPKRIMIFRSATYQHGVLEVAEKELTSIKKMLATYCKKNNKDIPTLTYLRVPYKKSFMKPHHLREPGPNIVQTGSIVNSIMSNQVVTSAVEGNQPNDDSVKQTPNWIVMKVYDENNLSLLEVAAMIHSLSYLSPRTTSKTRPTPIDLADLANERTRHISISWLEDNQDKYKKFSLAMLMDLNQFLTEEMGDDNYRDTLYYV